MSLHRFAFIVEGHGDVLALPRLVDRILAEAGASAIHERPHRVPRTRMLGPELDRAARFQASRLGGNGTLVILADADDDDPQHLRDQLHAQAPDGLPVVIGVAVREFEAWLLGGVESLRGHRAVRDDASYDGDVEGPRDAKGHLAGCMVESYKETIHQPAFAALIDLSATRERSPSFRRFCIDLWQAVGAGTQGIAPS